jgi:uncharacterized protein (TIGR03437 family)
MKGVFAVSGALLGLMTTAASAQVTIVNGASFDSSAPIAPSGFATVFGQNLCAQTLEASVGNDGAYPMALGGCSVMVNGAAAMMEYVSAGQMNFVVPANLPFGNASVVVSNGKQSISGAMTIGPGPGVFSLDGMGMGNGAMLQSLLWQTGPFSAMTGGQPTPVSIFMTGLDLSVKPTVTVGGVPVDVSWYGNIPGVPGLEQINITLAGNMAGVGRVPMTVTSNGQTSNVTFMNILPTTSMMMGMPGWNSGMTVGENMPRASEMSSLAFDSANGTALVTDEAGDSVRVISLSSLTTVATIALPAGSQAHSIAINSAGTLAAVGLTEKASVALIDLTKNAVTGTIGTGYYVSSLAFSGTNLLATNSASGTVAVVDANSLQVTKTIAVGFGPSGVAVSGNTAIVANMQAGSISLINLTTYGVTNLSLPAGARPHGVAISATANKALITDPMWRRAFILSLDTQKLTQVDLSSYGAMGSGAVAANGNIGYLGNQMNASVSVVDLSAGSVIKVFSVDHGPRSLAFNSAANQILVLCQGTGTLDVVDAGSFAVTTRINATSGSVSETWNLSTITSIAPTSAKAGTSNRSHHQRSEPARRNGCGVPALRRHDGWRNDGWRRSHLRPGYEH